MASAVRGRCDARQMPRLSEFDSQKLAATLAGQYGVVTRQQALDCAMSAKALRYRTRPEGPWEIVLPGVYATCRGRLTEKQRAVAAFLYAGRGIAITGQAAMAWHGLRQQQGEVIDVLVPLHYKRGDAGFARLLRTSIMPGVDFRDGAVSMCRWTARSPMLRVGYLTCRRYANSSHRLSSAARLASGS